MKIRTYSELMSLGTFEERFKYLSLRGSVGAHTFGFDRYLNQLFYTSAQWRHIRRDVILRDDGCDLGVDGFHVHHRATIHHLNPMTIEDIKFGDERILDPEFLITTTLRTHNAIHYGDERQVLQAFVERRPGDTKLW